MGMVSLQYVLSVARTLTPPTVDASTADALTADTPTADTPTADAPIIENTLFEENNNYFCHKMAFGLHQT